MNSEKVLLVTISIGDKYLKIYNKLFKPSQEFYAKKNGYDFKVITDFLDKKYQHYTTISFNKILVCSQSWSKNYDYIIFVDADIIINNNAPPIHNFINLGDNIGIADEFSQPNIEARKLFNKKNGFEKNPQEYYRLSELDINTDILLNTGVLILQPNKHNEFLKNIYNKYVEKSINHPREFHFEQSCIGYELQKNKKFKILDNKFNAIWILYKSYGYSDILKFYQDNYFIHFAGKKDLSLIEKLNKSIL